MDAPLLSPRYRPELIAVTAVMALYLSHVLVEMARRVREAEAGALAGWLSGGSLAVGTGLWAMNVLGALSRLSGSSVGHDAALSLASWLLGVASAFAALWCARRSDAPALVVLFGGVVCGAAFVLMHMLGVLALQLEPPVLRQPWVAAACLLVGLTGCMLLVGVLAGKMLFAPAFGGRRRAGLVLLTGVALVAQLYFALGAGGIAPGPGRGGELFPGDSLGVLAGLAAVVLLTMALLMSRLEVRLQGRTSRLAESLRQANEDLQKIAFLDPLTQLPNRHMFENRLAQAVARADHEGHRLALLFIDLDGFKPINDSFGHSSGDEVLREVGVRLRSLSRQGETMARVGGDEFLLLLEDKPDEADAALVAQRLIRVLGRPFDLGERDVSVSCSVGIVFYPDGGAQSKLIAHADAAMYAAKRAGGSTYCFYESHMDAGAREQVELLRDLRQALARKQLELYYQPKIDARSGQITSAEALLRWHHPQRGLISPGVFVPIAERFGLIGAIGNWVIDEVCRQSEEWHNQGLRMRVALNLSVHQMRQDDLVSRIRNALQRHNIDPKLLTCEITESVAMEDTHGTQATFMRLGRAGVHLSIDDFGTGYSSLASLRQLPAQELKIDRSFVLDLESSADARAIVDAVVRLAHALGLKVVAEGVETERQRDALMRLGCDELQGFLFAKPMSARALLLWAMDDKPLAVEFRPSLFDDAGAR